MIKLSINLIVNSRLFNKPYLPAFHEGWNSCSAENNWKGNDFLQIISSFAWMWKVLFDKWHYLLNKNAQVKSRFIAKHLLDPNRTLLDNREFILHDILRRSSIQGDVLFCSLYTHKKTLASKWHETINCAKVRNLH